VRARTRKTRRVKKRRQRKDEDEEGEEEVNEEEQEGEEQQQREQEEEAKEAGPSTTEMKTETVPDVNHANLITNSSDIATAPSAHVVPMVTVSVREEEKKEEETKTQSEQDVTTQQMHEASAEQIPPREENAEGTDMRNQPESQTTANGEPSQETLESLVQQLEHTKYERACLETRLQLRDDSTQQPPVPSPSQIQLQQQLPPRPVSSLSAYLPPSSTCAPVPGVPSVRVCLPPDQPELMHMLQVGLRA
jgi:hypothetical protein